MKQVAQMLGVELGEEFSLEGDFHPYRFTQNGVEWFGSNYREWIDEPSMLRPILVGAKKIIKQPWKPKPGEKYWFVSTDTNEVIAYYWADSSSDIMRGRLGNVFKTSSEAEANIEAFKEYLNKGPDISWRLG